MNKHQSKEDYLETILKLTNDDKGVHAIDIAKELGFSKPSVSIALKKLKELDYITIDSKTNAIFLTDEGLKIARRVYDRHKTITQWFINLGIRKDIAEMDACKIEHELSEETYQAIKKHIK